MTDTADTQPEPETPALPDPLTQAMDRAVDTLQSRVADYQAQLANGDPALTAAIEYAQARDWNLTDPVRHLDRHEEDIVRTTLGMPPSEPITVHQWLTSEGRRAIQDDRARREGWDARGFGSRADGKPLDRSDPDWAAWYARQRGPQQAPSFGARQPAEFGASDPSARMDATLRDMADEARANRPLVVRTGGT